MSGRKRDAKKPQGKKPLTNGWIVVPSKTYPDRVYFYNTVTRCSTWNNPCEDTDNIELNNSSSETSSERNFSFKAKLRPTGKSQLKKHSSQPILLSSDRNSNIRVNDEIEDYDDQDEYFSNSPKNVLSHSQLLSPSSSPGSVSSTKTNHNDSDRYSDSNELIENNKKQLWVHFVSNPEKPNVRKSVALSDFQGPSTSQNSGMEKINEIAKSDVNGFNKRKSKTRKKRRYNSEKKCGIRERNKNISFKRTDKTPAQTRLLKLRKQNAEKLRALVAKYPELGMSSTDVANMRKVRNSSAFDLEGLIENDKFNGSCLKRNEVCLSAAQETSNQVEVDYSEEMDWEPSSEESDVRNINVFRQQLDKPKEISSDFFELNSSQSSTLPCNTHSWFLILDTNIFVSCLPFVKELRDARVPDLGCPVIYVPWRVLQELDHLKDSKISAVDKNLHTNVRRAISYLNENFKLKHPRIFGQSFEDFSEMIDLETFAPDDEILQTCLQLQKRHRDKKLMLLTNDKNLESKAIVSGVEVYSKDRFQKKYLKSDSSSIFTNTLTKSANEGTSTSDSLCEVKEILKDFMSVFVETELRIAFEEYWIKVAVKKPPWSLQDVMQCFLKHWRSVFFLIFRKDTHSEVEVLYEKLFKRDAVTTEEVIDIIKITQRLIQSIKKSQKKSRPYLDLIPITMEKLSNLLHILSPSAQTEIISASTSLPSEPLVSDSHFNSNQISPTETCNNDILKVKTLFKDIWDSIRSFCCTVSDIINSPCVSTNTVVQETRLKLSQILNEFQELVVTIEKILEINPPDVNKDHPVIVHCSNFLIHAYPNMVPDLKNELPRCLAAFFTDFEGRSLLTSALKDFKEFILDLSKASEYFNAQYAL